MSDPERLSHRPTLAGGTAPRPAPGEHASQQAQAPAERQRRQDRPAPSYYDVPMLKPPVWTWEIAAYFFLGGLSAGAYLLARMAERFGGGRYRNVTRAGTAVAIAALTPCPLLLIDDLGDPKRFHYMLRVFKPQSPMNLGAWTITGYGGAVTLAALNEWRKRGRNGNEKQAASLAEKLVDGVISGIADGAGVPLALLLGGYTGVLLSSTSTPIWARNGWLGPLFSVGAFSTGASAVRLALEAAEPEMEKHPAHTPLLRAEQAAHLAEAVTLGGFLAAAGDLAAPVTQGRYALTLWGGAVGAGLILPALLEHAPIRSKQARRWLRLAGAAAGLTGGFLLRWAITQAGHPSGSDPQAARTASRSRK
jgi:formate-dependent nitrite reductase membrane component NrfD